ncbi:MAG TPA: 3'-5' exonuclease, partial [Polyangiales bacterium]|nr:3'-5' exonuclease [Polyangiales bacterium]
AIYAFRGADVFAYMNAARNSVDHAFTLATNYRSDPALLRGIDALFACAHAPFVFDDIVYRTVHAAPDARDRLAHAGASFEILFAPRHDEQKVNLATVNARLPKQIAAEIVRFLRSKPTIDGALVEAKHIAVLCRTNAQAMQVQAALREVSLPAVLDGDASVFDSEMAEELGRLLWALAEPADGSRVRAAIATSAIGVSARELAALERDEAQWDGWVARFHALHELWETRGFIAAFHGLCDQLNIGARLLARPDGERRYTDLTHLAELLHAEAMQSRKGPHALLDWYRRLRAGERIGMAQQDVQIRLESDAHAITLTTIHKSKGLQYPIVYCPFMWAGGLHSNELTTPQFHDREHEDRVTLVLSSPTELERTAAKREALAEQLRLLYVALTRAKHKLSVVWGALGSYDQSALAYLLHQPETRGEDVARATIERAKKLTDVELLRDLDRLVAAANGAIEVRTLIDEALPIESIPDESSSVVLVAREATQRPRDNMEVSSFSRLAAGESEHARAPEGLDRDEQAAVDMIDQL